MGISAFSDHPPVVVVPQCHIGAGDELAGIRRARNTHTKKIIRDNATAITPELVPLLNTNTNCFVGATTENTDDQTVPPRIKKI